MRDTGGPRIEWSSWLAITSSSRPPMVAGFTPPWRTGPIDLRLSATRLSGGSRPTTKVPGGGGEKRVTQSAAKRSNRRGSGKINRPMATWTRAYLTRGRRTLPLCPGRRRFLPPPGVVTEAEAEAEEAEEAEEEDTEGLRGTHPSSCPLFPLRRLPLTQATAATFRRGLGARAIDSAAGERARGSFERGYVRAAI